MSGDSNGREIASAIRIGGVRCEKVKPIAVQEQIKIATDSAVRAFQRYGAKIAAYLLTKSDVNDESPPCEVSSKEPVVSGNTSRNFSHEFAMK